MIKKRSEKNAILLRKISENYYAVYPEAVIITKHYQTILWFQKEILQYDLFLYNKTRSSFYDELFERWQKEPQDSSTLRKKSGCIN